MAPTNSTEFAVRYEATLNRVRDIWKRLFLRRAASPDPQPPPPMTPGAAFPHSQLKGTVVVTGDILRPTTSEPPSENLSE